MENFGIFISCIIPLVLGILLMAIVLFVKKLRTRPILVSIITFLSTALAAYSWISFGSADNINAIITALIVVSAIMLLLTVSIDTGEPLIIILLLSISVASLLTYLADSSKIIYFLGEAIACFVVLMGTVMYLGDATEKGNRVRFLVYPTSFILLSLIQIYIILLV